MNKDELFLLRRKKKIRLKDISKELGISIAAISRYENDLITLSKRNKDLYASFIINK